ncbi:MAG: SemiSWEET transporter [Hyphomonas sp.]
MSDFIGLIAACLTTISFLPQAVLVLRTGQTEGISLAMYSLFTIGVAAWLIYGIMIASLPIIVANIVTLALASLILWTKARAVMAAR